MIIPDEVCNDEEYNTATRIEEYFTNRKDVIEKVSRCEVVNYGNNVNFVVEVKIPRGWIFFFCDPKENYTDLNGELEQFSNFQSLWQVSELCLFQQ